MFGGAAFCPTTGKGILSFVLSFKTQYERTWLLLSCCVFDYVEVLVPMRCRMKFVVVCFFASTPALRRAPWMLGTLITPSS